MENKNKYIALGVVVLVLIIGVGMYNSLVKKDMAANGAWAQVDNVLQRRADLIPNLVSSVKGYAKHEKEIFEKLAEARAQYSGAKTVNEKMKAASAMDGALSRLLVIVENYPNLKANETFARLMDELSGTENRISVERMRFNQAVGDLNVAIRRFCVSMAMPVKISFPYKTLFFSFISKNSMGNTSADSRTSCWVQKTGVRFPFRFARIIIFSSDKSFSSDRSFKITITLTSDRFSIWQSFAALP